VVKLQNDREDPPGYYRSRAGAVAEVASRAGIDLVVLFGSAARGRLRTESDLDVAVRFVGERPGFEAEAAVAGELHGALQPSRELDLVLLNGASPTLLAHVAGDGILLHAASPELWPLFRLYARRRFEDTEPYRCRRWEALKERFLGMTLPRRHALLQRKLGSLATYLDELEATTPGTLEDYTSQPPMRRAVERLVQLVVEAAADAGDLLLAEEGQTVGEAARDIFEALHPAGVIGEDLRRRFAYEYAGLRNRIIHQYDELDDGAVWRAARQLVPDGRALLAALIARVDAGPASETTAPPAQ
jgi:uncharacterized protein YutE (UPF0331/DUF86 family)/predicted nucleotidyltransferase